MTEKKMLLFPIICILLAVPIIYIGSTKQIDSSKYITLKNLSIIPNSGTTFLDSMTIRANVTAINVKINPENVTTYQKVLISLNWFEDLKYFIFLFPFLLILYLHSLLSGSILNKLGYYVFTGVAMLAFFILPYYVRHLNNEINMYALSLIKNHGKYTFSSYIKIPIVFGMLLVNLIIFIYVSAFKLKKETDLTI